MVDYYDLYCRTCKSEAGFDNVSSNRGLLNIRRNISIYANAASLEPEIEDLQLKETYSSMPFGFLSWCKTHIDHDVVVRDQYGYYHDRCQKRINCPTCKSYAHCGLPLNHDGPCEPENI